MEQHNSPEQSKRVGLVRRTGDFLSKAFKRLRGPQSQPQPEYAPVPPVFTDQRPDFLHPVTTDMTRTPSTAYDPNAVEMVPHTPPAPGMRYETGKEYRDRIVAGMMGRTPEQVNDPNRSIGDHPPTKQVPLNPLAGDGLPYDPNAVEMVPHTPPAPGMRYETPIEYRGRIVATQMADPGAPRNPAIDPAGHPAPGQLPLDPGHRL